MYTRLFSLGLRGLIALQRRRLGQHADLVADAARLALSEDEAQVELGIRELRQALARDTRVLQLMDHGAGTRGFVGVGAKPSGRRVSDIYKRAAAPPAWGRFLFRLTRQLQPRRVLELGTSLGVSAAHIAAGLQLNESLAGVAGRLVTIEGDPGVAVLARSHLDRLGHEERVEIVTGRFADVLPGVLDASGPFDLAFVDGHHEEASTLAYWQMLRPVMTAGACVAFDDIEPGRPVRRAWNRIADVEALGSANAVDLLGLGLLFMPADGAGPPARVSAREIGAVTAGQ